MTATRSLGSTPYWFLKRCAKYPSDRQEYILKDATPKVVITYQVAYNNNDDCIPHFELVHNDFDGPSEQYLGAELVSL
jgi:hypothetical protein